MGRTCIPRLRARRTAASDRALSFSCCPRAEPPAFLTAPASDAALARFVREASLDKRAFETCLASGRAAASIQRDVAEGSEHGLSGTPGFFVNGRFLSGNQPVSAFAQVIDEELKDTR